MRVLKFGGTSVGSAERMKEVATLVTNGNENIVVLSAMAGTTNTLVEIAGYLYKKNNESAIEQLITLEKKYEKTINELFTTDEFKNKGRELVQSHFNYIKSFTQDMFTMYEEKAVLAQGELISTSLFYFLLQEQGVKSCLIPALNFMRIDKEN